MFYFVVTLIIIDILLIPYIYIKYNKLDMSYKEGALMLLDTFGYILILIPFIIFINVLLIFIVIFIIPIVALFFIWGSYGYW